ncbi:hypothetical protein LPMP_050670 [Leishmania panamensis]|uniref:Uncharacterized protein n=1 Tax=Leishmania panamensis TaxID=5679 RepID=A0A088RK08_LEIPA|nr:hypothetical protein LPMP_050670 [Leishmania panamensis]AIN95509.1 hypothetical protein LPMP_050670 [Leishmania panamensis]
MPSSSSYAAYLHEVALEMNATVSPGAITMCPTTDATEVIAARTTVAVPPSRLLRHRHQQGYDANHGHTNSSATTSCCSDQHTTESYEGSYAYDYLQVPAVGCLSRSNAVLLYEGWKQQQQRRVQAHMQRSSHSTRGVAVHSSSAPYTTSHLTAGIATRENEHKVNVDAMQRSFQHLYAVMKNEGRRQLHGTAETGRAAHLSHSISCSPHRQSRKSSTRSRRCHPDTASQQTQHGASTAIYIPSIDFDSDDIIIEDVSRHRSGMKTVQAAKEAMRAEKCVEISKSPQPAAGSTAISVKVVSPAPTSTDTSVITSSPSKPSTSSSRSCSPPRQSRGQRNQCPRCCRRCDLCHCVGLPRQVSVHARHSGGVVAVAGAARGESHPRSSSPAGGCWSTAAVDSVRLQWPGQSRTGSSRCPSPQQPSSPEARCSSTRSARHKSRQKSPAHGRHDRRYDRRVDRSRHGHHRETSSTAAAVLRDIATRTCTCYWAEFPGLTMAVNPVSHAAGCPYQAHEVLYTEVMLASKVDDGSSSSSSTSSRSRCSSSSSSDGRCDKSGRRSTSKHRRQERSTGTADASGRHDDARQRRTAQLRKTLDDPEAKRTRGRAAVMGSAKRRTYIEMMMDAARDSLPSASSRRPRSGGHGSTAKATASSFTTKKYLKATAAATPLLSSSMAQGRLPTGEAPPKLEDEQPQEQSPPPPSSRSASENDRAVAAAEAGEGATAVEKKHDKAGSSSREEKPPSASVGEAVGSTSYGNKPPAQETEKSPLPNEESPLRALSRPRCRPAVGVPGPGSYHVDLAYAASSAAHGIRGASIPKAPRMPAVKSTTPGPGAYDVYKREEEERKQLTAEVIAVRAAAATTTTDGDAAKGKETDATPAAGKPVIGKGIVFASTGARQLQLQYGDAYVHTSTWAKRAAAVPGPGAYNIVDGDHYDQSKPLGAARMGYHFSKSADGAHFCAAAAAATVAGGSAERQDGASSSPSPAPEKAGIRAAAELLRASFVVPWRDWAGGAYIGTTTSNFVAHPSLAGGDRRTLGQTVAADLTRVSCSKASAAVAAAEAAADGSVWKGVGSGVALRLTSQRFPVEVANAPATAVTATAVAKVQGSKTESNANAEGAAPPCGGPGPATYDLESALRWVHRRAPAVSMTFRHDRGPREPLCSVGGATDDGILSSAVGGGATLLSLSSSPHHLSDDAGLSPGPGTYDVRSGEAWRRRCSPQWSFGTAARHVSSAAVPVSAAGEGTNDLNSGNLGAVGHPGPGAYDTETGYRALQRSAASALMGTAARFTVDHSDRASAQASATEAGIADDGVRAGPSIYDVENCYAVLRERIKGGVIPRAGAAAWAKVGSEEAQCSGPGPGAYTLPALPPSGATAFLSTSAPRFPWEQTPAATVANGEGQGATVAAGAYPLHPSTDLFRANQVAPGPGSYDIDAATSLVNRPGAIIGRAPRASLLVPTGATSENVGPGSYMLPALPVGRGAVMLTARACAAAEAGDAAEQPGPGLYDPVDMRASSARAFSLARTSARFPDSDAHAADAPGPCAYGPPAAPVTRSAVFNTAPRFLPNSGDVADSLVGPGSYDPYRPNTAAPAHRIARARRFPDGDGDGDGTGADSVGPGAYEVVDLSPPGRSAVMGSAVARPTLEWKDGNSDGVTAVGSAAVGPGPGAYSPQYAQVERSAPRVVLARAPAGRGAVDYYASGDASMPFHAQHTGAGSGLGPGQYSPQYQTDLAQAGRGHTFGSAPRSAAAVESGVGGSGALDGPGPGAYEVRVTRDGRSVDGGDGSGAARFGTALRLAEEGTSATMSAGPGPGAYMPEAFTDMGAGGGNAALSSVVRFGTAPRILGGGDAGAAADVPGPGAYEPNPAMWWPTAPSISFPRANAAHALGGTDTPGPGAYITTTLAPPRAAHFGSAPRFEEGGTANAVSVPGPNAYSPNDAATLPAQSAHRFGAAARLTSVVEGAAEVDGVGPGAYDVETGLAYSSQGLTTAAYSFPRAGGSGSSRGQPSLGDKVAGGVAAFPGPGAYHLPPAFPEGPQWGFGTSMRSVAATGEAIVSSALATASPGPGEYAVPVPAPLHSGSSFPKAAIASPTGESISPGPGAYDVVDTAVRPSAPGVRFGSAVRHACADVSAVNLEAVAVGAHDEGAPWMPGPGAYSPNMNASSTLRSTRAGPTFAQAPRMAPSASVDAAGGRAGGEGSNIGPGAYDLQGGLSVSAAAAHRFGTAPRMPPTTASGAAAKSDVGPGSYEYPVTVQEHRRSALMLSRHNDLSGTTCNTPGPGAYDTTAALAAVQTSAAAYTFGTAPTQQRQSTETEMDALHTSPGPGSYDAASAYVSTQVARHPGGFTMQGRPVASMQVEPAEGPGPAAYAADTSAASVAPAHRFGTAPRMLSAPNGDAGVGPGTYDLPPLHATHQLVSFTQAPREVVIGPHDGGAGNLHSGDVRGGYVGGGTPGPGSYDVGSAIDSIQMGGRGPSITIPRGPRPVLRSGDVDASPLVGPGTYNPVYPTSHYHGGDSSGIHGPSAAFGLAERPVNVVKGSSDAPGPGTYDPHYPNLTNGVGIGSSFGSAARMDDVAAAALAATPGPGAYAVASSFHATSAAGSAPAVHFGTSKRPSAVLNENPGPGSYAVAHSNTAAAPSFGHTTRPDLLLNTNPGPGTYSLSPTWISGVGGATVGQSFGLSDRPTPVLNTNPGPGAYYRASNIDGASAAAGPSFGIGERMCVATGTATPGPGAYYKESLSAARGPSFGLAERPGPELNTNPGPGAYYRNSAASVAAGGAVGTSAGFGLGERHNPKLNDNPGPGTYFRGTLPAATQPRLRRPTAADTLRKLASVGYPTLASKTTPTTANTTTERHVTT